MGQQVEKVAEGSARIVGTDRSMSYADVAKAAKTPEDLQGMGEFMDLRQIAMRLPPTDAAILAGAGIPSVLFGPAGAGLHSLEEWVDIPSVLTCRDVLVGLARQWTRG